MKIVAPDGLICTAQFPAPVGSATVETIWSVSNASMAALNKLLATSPKYRHRAQCISDGCMATFNLGGINQYGEPFGLHLMDPLAAGSGAFATKDGIDAGGPITSPVSCIADVERNEQAVPLFYLHRRLVSDTGGAGKHRGGLSAEVALTLGGIEKAMALVMTHGAESPNTAGLAAVGRARQWFNPWAGAAIESGLPNETGKWERFGPKPGLMPMTNRDIYSVIWQGGGGWGDPLEREAAAVARDVSSGAVTAETAREIYGVVVNGSGADDAATERQREAIRKARVGNFDTDPAKRCAATADRIAERKPVHRTGRARHACRVACGLSSFRPAIRIGARARSRSPSTSCRSVTASTCMPTCAARCIIARRAARCSQSISIARMKRRPTTWCSNLRRCRGSLHEQD